jgi:hypothetical protein
MKYLVLKDTREKEIGAGWTFKSDSVCMGTQIQKLDTGDYTLNGYEHILCIERKASVSEFARNIVEKRFEKELERMDEFSYSYILLEFTEKDIDIFPKGSGIPRRVQKYVRIKPKFIHYRIKEIMEQHKVKIILCGEHGKAIAQEIFDFVVNDYAQSR